MADAAQFASLLLIIDADPGSLELLSNALARPGLEILTATSSEGDWICFAAGARRSLSLSSVCRSWVACKCWSRSSRPTLPRM